MNAIGSDSRWRARATAWGVAAFCAGLLACGETDRSPLGGEAGAGGGEAGGGNSATSAGGASSSAGGVATTGAVAGEAGSAQTSDGTTTGSSSGGSSSGGNGGAGGDLNLGGAGGERGEPACDGLAAYLATGDGRALGYTIYFVQGEVCEAYVAAHFFEPEPYQVRFEGSAIVLTPVDFGCYWEKRSAWYGRDSTVLQGLVLERDTTGTPTSAQANIAVRLYNLDLMAEFFETHDLSVQPLDSALHLRSVTPPNRNTLPWEPVVVSVWPPLEEPRALNQESSDSYGSWAISDLGSPGFDELEPDFPPRVPQRLHHSGVTAQPTSWRYQGMHLAVEASSLRDIAGRTLENAGVEVLYDDLPAPQSSHDFDADPTFRVYVDEALVERIDPPAACAAGCLVLADNGSLDGEAAGVVDTSGAGTLKLRLMGEGTARVLRPDGSVLWGSRIFEDAPIDVEIDTEGLAYLGVYFKVVNYEWNDALFIDRVWAE